MSEEEKVLMYLDMRGVKSKKPLPDFVPIENDEIFWSGEGPGLDDRFPYNVVRELMPDWWNDAYNDDTIQSPEDRSMVGVNMSSLAKFGTPIHFCFEYPWDVEVNEKAEKLTAQLTTVKQTPAW